MMKLTCCKCGCEEAHENHKSAWMAGWDWAFGQTYCGDCSVMPSSKDVVKNKSAQNSEPALQNE